MMIGSCSFFISLFDDLSLVTSFAETLRHILCLCGKNVLLCHKCELVIGDLLSTR
uniref:Uncharacterized protein n=1 Tax=Anguilla anguilla TaxID=7936 RepID=A0A0E9RSD0_ANGAN